MTKLIFKNFRSITISCPSHEAREALDFIFSHHKSAKIDEKLKEILHNQIWTNFDYRIKLSLKIKLRKKDKISPQMSEENDKDDEQDDLEEDVFGSFTFIHLLILCQEVDILSYIVQNHKVN